MLKKTGIAVLAALTLSSGGAFAAGAGDWAETTNYEFSFEGPFGSFDQDQLQRGLQVYTEICSACHGMKFVPLRTLSSETGPGFTMEEVRAYAEQNYEVFDEELDDYRAARPTDHFPESNLENAPDMSLMAKKRAGFHGPYGTGINQLVKGMGGAEYIASLLTSYTGETKEEAGVILYENTAYPGRWIAMAPPLYGDDVEYADGSATTIESQSKDVAAFLMWAAEPKMMDRKQAGLTGVLFLTILSVLLYLTNKRLWAPIKKGKKS